LTVNYKKNRAIAGRTARCCCKFRCVDTHRNLQQHRV